MYPLTMACMHVHVYVHVSFIIIHTCTCSCIYGLVHALTRYLPHAVTTLWRLQPETELDSSFHACLVQSKHGTDTNNLNFNLNILIKHKWTFSAHWISGWTFPGDRAETEGRLVVCAGTASFMFRGLLTTDWAVKCDYTQLVLRPWIHTTIF